MAFSENFTRILQLALVATLLCFANAFQKPCPLVRLQHGRQSRSVLAMELELNTATYAGIFFATMIPSLAIIKFVGDSADSSRDKVSVKTKEKFKRAMMEQPGSNFALPTSEEEALKKQIAKAYMQDRDVDVAVLEEKLRKRAEWRKEMMAQAKASQNNPSDPEDEGW